MTQVNGSMSPDEGGFWCFAGCAAFCGVWCMSTYGGATFMATNLGIAAAYNL